MSAWTMPSYAEWAVPGYTEERLLGRGVSGRVVAASTTPPASRWRSSTSTTSLVIRDPEFLPGFRAEAEQLKSLDVPHMVRLFDSWSSPAQGAALVTELVEGSRCAR